MGILLIKNHILLLREHYKNKISIQRFNYQLSYLKASRLH